MNPKRSLAAHLSLMWLPWIVGFLLWNFVYNLKEFPYPNDYPRIQARGRQFCMQPTMRNEMETRGQVCYNRIYSDPLVQIVRYVVTTIWLLSGTVYLIYTQLLSMSADRFSILNARTRNVVVTKTDIPQSQEIKELCNRSINFLWSSTNML